MTIKLVMNILVGTALLAQSRVHTPANERQMDAQRTRSAAITVDVDLVLVPVSVTDRYGKSVIGLKAEQFRIFEDGVSQPIVSFSSEDAPVSVGVVFDVSGSMRRKMSASRSAARSFLDTLNPEDEMFLLTFADTPQLRVGFTSNFAEVQNSLIAEENTGSTALIDAVALGLRELRGAKTSRKALVVVSDGQDNNSRLSKGELMRAAVEADAQIYTIGIYDNPRSIVERVEQSAGISLLEDLAKATGGRHCGIRDVAQLAETMAKVGEALHNQYVIGYRPVGARQEGKWRKIRVALEPTGQKPSPRIAARSGYYAPAK